MKKLCTSMLVCMFILLACKKKTDLPEEEKIDWDKASIAVMNSMRPKLLGSWKIKSVTIAPFAPNTSEIGIYRDSVLYDLAELNLNQVNNSGYYEKGNDVTGVISFKSKHYPVGFRMHVLPDRIINRRGPQAFAFFEYRFPVGVRLTEPEEDYLRNLMLINENFEIEISEDGKLMNWKGLNRAIKNIRFEK